VQCTPKTPPFTFACVTSVNKKLLVGIRSFQPSLFDLPGFPPAFDFATVTRWILER
jgi:hypothetical protein